MYYSNFRGKLRDFKEQNIKSCFDPLNIEKCDNNRWSSWTVENKIFNDKKRYI